MTHQQFYEYKEKAFLSFCTKLIFNEGIEALRKLDQEKSVPLSALSESEISKLSVEDTYHPTHRPFLVRGQIIKIYDWSLGQALGCLEPGLREVVLLYYYFGYSDAEIGYMLGLSGGAVRYRRTVGLQKLKMVLEVLVSD